VGAPPLIVNRRVALVSAGDTDNGTDATELDNVNNV